MLLNTELYKKHTARKVSKNISHLVQSTEPKISDILKPEDIRYMSSTHEVNDKFNCKTRKLMQA
jgi:hypothetical protein